MVSSFYTRPAPDSPNPYIKGLLGSRIYKPDYTIYYVLDDNRGGNGFLNDGGIAWRNNGARDAFVAAVAEWNAVANTNIKSWILSYDGSRSDIITWVEQIGFLGADSPELGEHGLPNAPEQVGIFNSQHPVFTRENNARGGYSFVTFLHEIGHGLGLDHPHDGVLFPGVSQPEDRGAGGLNQGVFTVMSYNDGYDMKGDSPSDAYGWMTTPGALDIAAIQAAYGANMATRTGDDVYRVPGVNAPGTGYACIWDAGGSDTISAEGVTADCQIYLAAATLEFGYAYAGGRLSSAAGIYGGFTIANGVVIENATGGQGNDTIIGNVAANLLRGGDGNDSLDGGLGADMLFGDTGNDQIYIDLANGFQGDRIDGGLGDDTLFLNNYGGNYYSTAREGDGIRISNTQGSFFITGIETITTGTRMTVDEFRIAQMDGLRYIASYPDLIAAIGNNDQVGRRHFIDYGELEGRTITFDPIAYAAVNPDLIAVLGGSTPNLRGLAEHYIQYGAAEGRKVSGFDTLSYLAANPFLYFQYGNDPKALTDDYVRNGYRIGRGTTFDAYNYLAANLDVLAGVGPNPTRAAEHYILAGYRENRSLGNFNSYGYLASNPDLIAQFQADKSKAVVHYVEHGFAEGRLTYGFDPLRYIASNPDLIGTYDTGRALAHFVDVGYLQGRSATSFDPLTYIASYPDLLRAFGFDTTSATRHYIAGGYREGRVDDLFDPLSYIASYSDLIRAFGTDTVRATKHYIGAGFTEGRVDDRFDALNYIASYSDLIRAFGNDTARATTHYIRWGFAEGRVDDRFDALNYIASYADLTRAFGTDALRATQHYIRWGYAEGRVADRFDPVTYLLANSDLGAAGLGPEGALRHWLLAGFNEGRSATGRFGTEQASHALDVGGSQSGALETALDRDWYRVALDGGEQVTVRMAGAGSGAGSLPDALISLHDAQGRNVAFDDDSGPGDDAALTFTPVADGIYYVVATNAAGTGAGSYVLSVEPVIG